MFEGDFTDMCANKFLLMLMEGQVEGLACADPGARTPIGMSVNYAGCHQLEQLQGENGEGAEEKHDEGQDSQK